jgi:hypothetical protein
MYEVDGIRVVGPVAGGYNDPHMGNGPERLATNAQVLTNSRGWPRESPKSRTGPDVVFATHTPHDGGPWRASRPAGTLACRFVSRSATCGPRRTWRSAPHEQPAGNLVAPAHGAENLRGADHIWRCRRACRRASCGRGVAASQVTVIPNGSDLDLFRPDRTQCGAPSAGAGRPIRRAVFRGLGLANGLEYAIERLWVLA